SDTVETAKALWAYAAGLAAFSAVRVMVPAYYSLGMARIPVMISFVSIGVTVGLNFLLMGPMRHAGLALATSIGSVLNFALLFWMLRSRIGGIGGRMLAFSAAKISVAAALAGGAAWFTAGAVEGVTGLEGLVARLVVVGTGLAAAAVVFVGAATILRVEELQRLLGRLRGT
ncbi:MAG TPA: lipid II flippase MurJ, partial [Thermoanaerobaculia bacterium]